MPDRLDAPDRLQFADALRGLGALVVVFAHATPVNVSWLPVFDPLNLIGRACVVVFFLVSGFFLPITCERGGSVARFAIRRLFRLFPAYWLCLSLALAIHLSGVTLHSAPATLTARDWLLNLTMTQELVRKPSVLYVFWTLPIELVVYAAFAIAFALNLHRRSVGLVVAMLGVNLVVGLGQLVEGKSFGVFGKNFMFFAPVMGLLAYRRMEGRSGTGPLWALGLGQIGLLGLGWAANRALGRADANADITTLVLLFVWSFSYGAFFLAYALRSWRMPALLVRVGQISYSVYLLHMIVMSVLAPLGLSGGASLALLFAGSLAVGELSYRFVEEPSIRLGRAVEKWLLPKSAGGAEPRPRRSVLASVFSFARVR